MKEVYALRNNLNEVMKSSSGGAFIAICECLTDMFGQGNITYYGACYNENMEVVHDRVTNLQDCSKFQGSKYVKSYNNNCYQRVENDLLDEKYVLFSGTPCQIYALNVFLKNKNIKTDKLITVDIICHGTPEIKIWREYKQWLESRKNSKLKDYSFRYKPEGWKAYPACATFENSQKLINTPETSVYSKLHMKGYSVSKGCFKCPFSNEDRNGDITLGDYWGIECIDKHIYEKNGVSLVIINTEKGFNIINSLKEKKDIVIAKTNSDEYLRYQHNLKASTCKPENYDQFWSDFNQYGFEFVIKKYLNYGKIYRLKYLLKKVIRKTPLINVYRSLKNKKG